MRIALVSTNLMASCIPLQCENFQIGMVLQILESCTVLLDSLGENMVPVFCEWLRDVFVGGWWQRIWFTITAPLAVGISVFGAQSHPVLRWLPSIAFGGGFVVSNLATYSAMRNRLDEMLRQLHDLTAVLKQVRAGEYLTLSADKSKASRHSLVIEFLIAFKNGDGHDSRSVEVENCTCDVSNATLESLKFFGDPYSPVASPPGPYRAIDAGKSIDIVANASFLIPYDVTPISCNEINGTLFLKDNRGIALKLSFRTPIMRNEIARV